MTMDPEVRRELDELRQRVDELERELASLRNDPRRPAIPPGDVPGDPLQRRPGPPPGTYPSMEGSAE